MLAIGNISNARPHPDIVTGLTDDSEWRLDVLDESGKPVFRLRLLAESLDKTAQSPFAIGPRPIS